MRSCDCLLGLSELVTTCPRRALISVLKFSTHNCVIVLLSSVGWYHPMVSRTRCVCYQGNKVCPLSGQQGVSIVRATRCVCCQGNNVCLLSKRGGVAVVGDLRNPVAGVVQNLLLETHSCIHESTHTHKLGEISSNVWARMHASVCLFLTKDPCVYGSFSAISCEWCSECSLSRNILCCSELARRQVNQVERVQEEIPTGETEKGERDLLNWMVPELSWMLLYHSSYFIAGIQ